VSRAIRALALAAATLLPLLGGPLGLPPAPVVSAAAPSLTLVGDSTYTVAPDAGRVHVSTTLTATNHLTDTITKQFFFRTAYLSVLPNTTAFKLTAAGTKPKVSGCQRKNR